jgi:hypothetical protein
MENSISTLSAYLGFDASTFTLTNAHNHAFKKYHARTKAILPQSVASILYEYAKSHLTISPAFQAVLSTHDYVFAETITTEESDDKGMYNILSKKVVFRGCDPEPHPNIDTEVHTCTETKNVKSSHNGNEFINEITETSTSSSSVDIDDDFFLDSADAGNTYPHKTFFIAELEVDTNTDLFILDHYLAYTGVPGFNEPADQQILRQHLSGGSGDSGFRDSASQKKERIKFRENLIRNLTSLYVKDKEYTLERIFKELDQGIVDTDKITAAVIAELRLKIAQQNSVSDDNVKVNRDILDFLDKFPANEANFDKFINAFILYFSNIPLPKRPVGALTSKPYAYAARSWELQHTHTIDFFDGMCSDIIVHSRILSKTSTKASIPYTYTNTQTESASMENRIPSTSTNTCVDDLASTDSDTDTNADADTNNPETSLNVEEGILRIVPRQGGLYEEN